MTCLVVSWSSLLRCHDESVSAMSSNSTKSVELLSCALLPCYVSHASKWPCCCFKKFASCLVVLVIRKLCTRIRWSLYRFQPKSSHLSSGILGLPSWCLVHPFPPGARICIAYHISHIMTCIASCCLCIAPWLIVVPLLVLLLWIEPGDEFVNEEPVAYANEDQAFDNSENFAGKMTIPSKSLLSLLASCPLYCYDVIPTTWYIMPPILPCQAFNAPFLANRCLAMLPLCSAPLIALLVAGEDEVCSMMEHGYVGISQYLLLN